MFLIVLAEEKFCRAGLACLNRQLQFLQAMEEEVK